MMEVIAAIFILVVVTDLIFDFFIGASRNSRKNDDVFAMSLAFESTLNTLNPKSYTIEELKKVLKQEADLNNLDTRKVHLEISSEGKKAFVRFLQKGRQIYRTELQLPWKNFGWA